MVGVFLPDKTGIFRSLAMAVSCCGYLDKKNLVEDEFRTLQIAIVRYYKPEILLQMKLDDVGHIQLDRIYKKPESKV